MNRHTRKKGRNNAGRSSNAPVVSTKHSPPPAKPDNLGAISPASTHGAVLSPSVRRRAVRRRSIAISTGNVQETTARKGWFLGHFKTGNMDCFTRDVEAKWGVHRITVEDKPFEGSLRARSMSILISGRFRFEFRRGQRIHRAVLQKPGDYVVWYPNVDHRGFAEVDETLMLTIRWPSLPGDHYERPQ